MLLRRLLPDGRKNLVCSPDFFGGTATRRDGEAGSRACVRKAHEYSPPAVPASEEAEGNERGNGGRVKGTKVRVGCKRCKAKRSWIDRSLRSGLDELLCDKGTNLLEWDDSAV